MAGAPDMAPAWTVVQLDDPRAHPPPDALVLELSPCERPVRGRVRDAGGPVVGARIAIGRRLDFVTGPIALVETRSGPDGAFALCPPGGGGWAEAEGYGRTMFEVGGRDWLDLVMVPAGGIAGRVVDPEGEPVSGALVQLIGSGGAQNRPTTGLAGDDGTFRFAVAPGEYEASADRAGYLWMGWGVGRHITVRAGEHVDGIIIMERCRPISGRAVAAGQSIAGATLRLGPPVITQQDGSFVAWCVPPGTYEVRLVAPASLAGDAPVVTIERGGQQRRVILVHAGAGTASVAGVVRDDAGDPVADAWVRVPRGGATASGSDGAFELHDLPRGAAVELAASAPGRGRATVSVEAGARDVVIELPRPAMIRGTVRGAGAGWTVRARSLRGLRVTHTDDGGAFSLDWLEPDTYQLEARGEGQVAVAVIELASGEVAAPALSPAALGRIAGVARFEDGRPADGLLCGASASVDPPVATDAGGRFVIEVPSGPTTVRCVALPAGDDGFLATAGLGGDAEVVAAAGDEVQVELIVAEEPSILERVAGAGR